MYFINSSTIFYHAQCVKIDSDGAKHYFDLKSNFEVVIGTSDFEFNGMNEEYMYVEPAVFREAAMRFVPDITYQQLRDFLFERSRKVATK